MSILVACVGNIFQGDDAFGCEVAKVLMQRVRSDNVRVRDFGIRGLDLTYELMNAPELTILVDTVARGGEPGTLYTLEPDLNADEFDSAGNVDGHAMDPVQVLRSAKAMGGHLKRVLVVGCEPADLGGEEGRMGLTPAVAAAVQRAADMVEALVGKDVQVS